MAVRSTLGIDIAPLADLEAYIKGIDDMAFEIGQDVFRKVQPPFTDELQYYPPPRPKAWYKRTYRLRRGWSVRLERVQQAGFRVVVSNRVPYTADVMGSPAPGGAAFQSAFFKRRGWFPAETTATYWFGVINTEFAKAFAKELDTFAKASSRKRRGTRL